MTDGLLLIHAFPLDARMWEAQRLGRHTIAPDLPGFGMAPAGGRTMTMADAAARMPRRPPIRPGSIDSSCAVCRWAATSPSSCGARLETRIAGLVLANTRAGGGHARGGRGPPRARGSDCGPRATSCAVAPPPLLAADAPVELQERVRGWIADQTAEAIAAAAPRDGRARRLHPGPARDRRARPW